MSCNSFCDDYYLPRQQFKFKKQSKKLAHGFTPMDDTPSITKLRRKLCIQSFCTPSCVNKLNRKQTKKFKMFKKRGALSACNNLALL